MKVKLTKPVEHRGELQPEGKQLDVTDTTGRYLIARKKAVEVDDAAKPKSAGKSAGKSTGTGNKE